MKDYYKTLGVPTSAAIAEIKTAYRALAFKYHPDKNPGDSLSEAQFKELQEAYSVLSNNYKRQAYDDERWLVGMGGKTVQVVEATPLWLLNVSVQLNASLALMDTYSISPGALKAYILLILRDAHLAILHKDGDRETIRAIVGEIIRATKRLDAKYLDDITQRLVILANGDEPTVDAIYQNEEIRMKKLRQEKFLPYFIILITLILCLFMYLFGGISKP